MALKLYVVRTEEKITAGFYYACGESFTHKSCKISILTNNLLLADISHCPTDTLHCTSSFQRTHQVPRGIAGRLARGVHRRRHQNLRKEKKSQKFLLIKFLTKTYF